MASIINNSNQQQLTITAPTFPSPLTEKAVLSTIAAEEGVVDRSPAARDMVALHSPITTTPPSEDGVRVLTLSEYKQAALTLAHAFKDDHTSVYFTHTPDRKDWTEQQKWELHLKMMEYITYAHLLKGLVVCAGPGYDCVALWMPPGQNMDDTLTILRSGLWRLSYLLSREGRKRFFDEFLPLLNDTKAHVLGPARDADSWYLVYIGTKPSSQGKGYGKAAIEYVTRMADEQGKACYLESSKEVNLKIYGKRGFELKKEVFLQRGMENVKLDIMVREPVRRDGDSGVEVM